MNIRFNTNLHFRIFLILIITHKICWGGDSIKDHPFLTHPTFSMPPKEILALNCQEKDSITVALTKGGFSDSEAQKIYFKQLTDCLFKEKLDLVSVNNVVQQKGCTYQIQFTTEHLVFEDVLLKLTPQGEIDQTFCPIFNETHILKNRLIEPLNLSNLSEHFRLLSYSSNILEQKLTIQRPYSILNVFVPIAALPFGLQDFFWFLDKFKQNQFKHTLTVITPDDRVKIYDISR